MIAYNIYVAFPLDNLNKNMHSCMYIFMFKIEKNNEVAAYIFEQLGWEGLLMTGHRLTQRKKNGAKMTTQDTCVNCLQFWQIFVYNVYNLI